MFRAHVRAVWELPRGGYPPVNVFNLLVVLLCLSWGVRNSPHRSQLQTLICHHIPQVIEPCHCCQAYVPYPQSVRVTRCFWQWIKLSWCQFATHIICSACRRRRPWSPRGHCLSLVVLTTSVSVCLPVCLCVYLCVCVWCRRFVVMNFMSSRAAKQAADEMKTIREDLTVDTVDGTAFPSK